MKIKIFVVLFLSVGLFQTTAQERKFGDITIAELEEKQDPVFKDEHAVILYRNIDFAYGNALEVHERVKIYTSEGFEHSDWTLRFDDVKSLKAATYNLENGSIVKTKVTKSGIFKVEVSEDEEISKLTFPNIKEGAIIELKYKVPFIGLSTLYSQMGLPIRYQRINVHNGYYGNLSIRENHYVSLPIRRIDGNANSMFIGENVPPIKDEAFVDNVNNHRGKIFMERHGVAYKQTWTSVANTYRNLKWFGEQLRSGYALYKRDLNELLGNETDSLTIAKKIDRYVKNTIEWNNLYSRGTEYVKSVYRDKTGDSGDINLLLVQMLRSRGLNANPILVATKSKGWVMYPQANAFNTVLCALKIDGKQYILDGSQKNAAFGQVPLRYINDKGLIIFSDDTHELYPLTVKETSKNTLIVNVELNTDDFSVNGDVKKQITEYYALEHREFYTDLKKETYKEALNKIDLLEVPKVDKKYMEDSEKPIQISYSFKYNDYLEEIGNSIYFEPLLYMGLKENLFNEEDRLYPINLEHPYSENYIINFSIPEGYTVKNIPEGKALKLPEDVGSLKFNIQQRGNKLQVLFNLNINHYHLPADYYPALKALYSEYFTLSKSKIELLKT